MHSLSLWLQDGYAVLHSDLQVQTPELQVIEKQSFAGVSHIDLEGMTFQPGSALYVTTGSPVPSFFDTVVIVEDTRLVKGNKFIEITSTAYSKG